MSTDAIRRILTYYFNFKIKINFIRNMMNITDVDDKIILRGRQQHPLAKLKKDNTSISDTVRSDTKKAFDAYVKKNLSIVEDVAPVNFDTSFQDMDSYMFSGSQFVAEIRS